MIEKTNRKTGKPIVEKDNWENLKSFTNARIAPGSVGVSLPLKEVLDFKLAHANAKDSIYSELNFEVLGNELEKFNLPVFTLQSKVTNREEYLKRPDLGRKLNCESKEILQNANENFDVVFLLTDGLSAEAVNKHSINLLEIILPQTTEKYKTVIALVKYGRVAIGDETGSLLNAKFNAVLIGERPGLSSPDSMGIYTTYNPQPGLTDERRNCISNVHKNGLSYRDAASIFNYLIEQSFAKQISGVNLKVEIGKLIGKS